MKTVIFGNGAMARVLFSYARFTMPIAAFTVDDAFCTTADFCGLPLVPFSAVADAYNPATHRMLVAVGFTDMNRLREQKCTQAAARGYRLASYVHPAVMPHDGVVLEENTMILDHVSIHPGCRIGRGSFISSNVNVGHDCDIGDFTWINSGVAIAGFCRVGTGCVFGVNAAAADNIRVGNRNFVGANTLVHRSTADDEVYLGEAGAKFRLRSEAFLRFAQRKKEAVLF